MPRSRCTGYRHEYDREISGEIENEVCRLLAESSIVHQYTCKKGICWYNLVSGAEARNLKKKIKHLLEIQ